MDTTESPSEGAIFSPEIKNWEIEVILKGLEIIGNLEISNFDLNIAIINNISALKKPFQAYTKALQALRKRHIKTDDDGNFITTDDKKFYIYKSLDDRSAFEIESDKLQETKVTGLFLPLKLSDLKKVESYDEKDKDGNTIKKNVLTATLIAMCGNLVTQ